MRGMLVKDFRLLSNQKQFFMVVIVIALMLAVMEQDIFFIISYATMIGAFYAVSTISYDEFNHGYAFLFTMPISRRGYAVEKYLFAFLMGGAIWLVTTAAGALYSWGKEPGMNVAEWFVTAAFIFLALESVLSVMLAVQLKFGADKSRVASVVFLFFFMGVLMLAKEAGEMLDAPQWNLDWIYSIGMVGWLLIAIAAYGIVAGISLAVSIHVMEKKQF